MPINQLPTWLDPSKEISNYKKPEWFTSLSRPKQDAVFYLWCFDSFSYAAKEKGLTISLNANALAEITANAAVETGHGQKWSGNNWGGVKINKPFVTDYLNTHGESPKWFKDEGHVNGGDQPIVYYTYFETPQTYAKYWLEKFVPIDYYREEEKEDSKKSRYYKTAKAFWESNNPTHWFYELCVSGYKGEVTKKNPGPSVDTLFSCKTRVMILVSQLLLEVTPDGEWGKLSKEACSKFQIRFNLSNKSGTLDPETFQVLVNSYFTLAEFSKSFTSFKF